MLVEFRDSVFDCVVVMGMVEVEEEEMLLEVELMS